VDLLHRAVELSIVIPTYNEKEFARESIISSAEQLKQICSSGEIVVVDDSTDKTIDTLNQLRREVKSLKVIHRKKARGVGSAIRLGLGQAAGKFAIILMADAPYDSDYFVSILEKLRQGYQLVSTSRFLPGCKIVRYPPTKRLGNFLCNNVIKAAFLRWDLGDFTTLFKGLQRKPILKLGLESNGFELGAEMEMKAIKRGYKISEVAVDWVERSTGSSKLVLRQQAAGYIEQLLKVRFCY
jgi:glycosyltransferase involved in cell wall biosynthesis